MAGGPSASRKLAEWFTMGLSAFLILGVAGYLVCQIFQADEPFVVITLRVLSQQAQSTAGQFNVPVEVRNLGYRTVKDFKGEVSLRAPDGKTERREFKLDYLGERATQQVYLYFTQPPLDGRLEAKPLEYRLE